VIKIKIKMHVRNECDEKSEEKWMNAKGGAAALWGVQKVKKKKRRIGARMGLGLGLKPGRVRREYIKVLRQFSFIFLFSFSLFFFLEREALFSLLSIFIFSDWRKGAAVVGGKSDAVAGELSRRRHRVGKKTLFFF